LEAVQRGGAVAGCGWGGRSSPLPSILHDLSTTNFATFSYPLSRVIHRLASPVAARAAGTRASFASGVPACAARVSGVATPSRSRAGPSAIGACQPAIPANQLTVATSRTAIAFASAITHSACAADRTSTPRDSIINKTGIFALSVENIIIRNHIFIAGFAITNKN
jgi:hypothetical protein